MAGDAHREREHRVRILSIDGDSAGAWNPRMAGRDAWNPRMGPSFRIRRGATAVPYPSRLRHSLSGAAALTLGVVAPSALMQQRARMARARGIRGWGAESEDGWAQRVVAFHRQSGCEISGHRGGCERASGAQRGLSGGDAAADASGGRGDAGRGENRGSGGVRPGGGMVGGGRPRSAHMG
jgi:hypothetical protein